MSADQETLDSFAEPTRNEPPEREGIYWGGDERYVDDLFVVGQIGQCGPTDVSNNSVAWILHGLTDYLDSRNTVEVEIPSTYSDWESEFGDGDGLYRGSVVERNGETVRFGLLATRVKAAMRSLTGGGRYDSSEYELFDCVPVPVLQGPEGAVAIAPVEVRMDD